MAISEIIPSVSSKLFTFNGTSLGVVTVADTTGFQEKQTVTITANSQPTLSCIVQKILSSTQIVVGPSGSQFSAVQDLTLYTTAASATIFAIEQLKPILSLEYISNAVFQPGPISSNRSSLIDESGNTYNTSNRLPVDASVSIGSVSIVQPLTVRLNDGVGNSITSQVSFGQRALDVGVNVSGVQIDPRSIRTLTSSDTTTAVQSSGSNLHVNIDNFPANQTVTISNTPSVIVSSLPSIPSGSNSIGSVSVINFPATQPISGTVSVIQPVTVNQGTSPWVTSGSISVINTLTTNAQVKDGSGNSITSEIYDSITSLDVKIGKGPQVDSYNRIRIASPEPILGLYFSNTNHPLYFNTSTTGAGTLAFNSTQGLIDLTTTTSATDSVITQSRKRIKYNPGISHSVYFTGIMGTAKANVRKRWGFFDTKDGLFFEQNGTTDVAIVQRTFSSGSAVDTRVVQASWNIDKLDGTGASGVTLDFSKHNAFVIDYVWQGAGGVRFGILFNDSVIYCHRFSNGNTLSLPYMVTPQLPVRAELVNIGAVASSTTMKLVCTTVVKESTVITESPYSFAATRGRTSISPAATEIPLISLRPKTTFNGISTRIPIIPKNIDITTLTNPVIMRCYLNATLTGASFTSAGTNSASEFDITATAISGGTLLWESYIGTSSGGFNNIDLSSLSGIGELGFDLAGTADQFNVSVQSTAGATTTFGGIGWEELQ